MGGIYRVAAGEWPKPRGCAMIRRPSKFTLRTIAPERLAPGDKIAIGCGVAEVLAVAIAGDRVTVKTRTQGEVSFHRSNWPQLAVPNPKYGS